MSWMRASCICAWRMYWLLLMAELLKKSASILSNASIPGAMTAKDGGVVGDGDGDGNSWY